MDGVRLLALTCTSAASNAGAEVSEAVIPAWPNTAPDNSAAKPTPVNARIIVPILSFELSFASDGSSGQAGTSTTEDARTGKSLGENPNNANHTTSQNSFPLAFNHFAHDLHRRSNRPPLCSSRKLRARP